MWCSRTSRATSPASPSRPRTRPSLERLARVTSLAASLLFPVAVTAEPFTVKPSVFDDAVSPARPVIMIDPGHGGIDPGAIGPGKTTEKTIVLAVALQLKSALDALERYDVRLTRASDTFIPLDKRVALSKQAGAGIFISLHADTIDNANLARSIRGASIYTLSDKASNEEARIMAEKENAADLVAGLPQHTPESGGDVKPILFDLMARETAAFSKLLSHTLAGAMSRNHTLTHDPERAAAFRVLRQADAPSVLIELGFLSHPAEEQMMTGATWQRQVASTIATAIDTYFSRKSSMMATAPFGGDLGGLPP